LVPGELIGQRVQARADSRLVKIYHRGQLIKTHPRKPLGGRSTDPTDYPVGQAEYALYDVATLKKKATAAGVSVGVYAARLLDVPLPWTSMRAVYWLLGLTRSYGAPAVEAACARALELDVIDVRKIARMLEQASEHQPAPAGAKVVVGGPASRTSTATPSPVPIIDADLKKLMRTLKLGRMLDTLPERLALANQGDDTVEDPASHDAERQLMNFVSTIRSPGTSTCGDMTRRAYPSALSGHPSSPSSCQRSRIPVARMAAGQGTLSGQSKGGSRSASSGTDSPDRKVSDWTGKGRTGEDAGGEGGEAEGGEAEGGRGPVGWSTACATILCPSSDGSSIRSRRPVFASARLVMIR
jgi:Mu transposase-like protein